eukprot:PhM_4_TR18488/c1_g1_i1/m.65357
MEYLLEDDEDAAAIAEGDAIKYVCAETKPMDAKEKLSAKHSHAAPISVIPKTTTSPTPIVVTLEELAKTNNNTTTHNRITEAFSRGYLYVDVPASHRRFAALSKTHTVSKRFFDSLSPIARDVFNLKSCGMVSVNWY